ncbi:MAG: DUF805 domain-containing protein [Prevotella sp.]|jgi:uncharacterized membrane protein YhaH (DUF805 family)|nr:DUF805 domain-containing protein [Prevotella sp.]
MGMNHLPQVLPSLKFNQAVKRVFHHYWAFRGRARRSEYWWFKLFEMLAFFLANCLDTLITNFILNHFNLHFRGSVGVLTLIVFVGLLLPDLAVFWRRFHDIGRSGWYWLVFFVPIVLSTVLASFTYAGSIFFGILGLVAFAALLALCCLDSRKEINKYGPSPKYK